MQEGEAVLEGIAALQEFDKAVLRKVIDQINVYGEGRSKVVWKSEDMFGVEKISRKSSGSHVRMLVTLLVLEYNTVQKKRTIITYLM